jgi:hypothetical protein
MVKPTNKVDSSLLGETDDAYGDVTLDGRLFSGVAYEKDAPTGALLALTGYREGKAHGPLRVWYPSGQIRTEVYNHGGGLHGPWREWYPDGGLSLDSYYEHNFKLRSKRWSEEGRLIETFELDPASPAFSDVSERRAKRNDPIVDIDLNDWELVERAAGWGRDETELPDAASLEARWPRG